MKKAAAAAAALALGFTVIVGGASAAYAEGEPDQAAPAAVAAEQPAAKPAAEKQEAAPKAEDTSAPAADPAPQPVAPAEEKSEPKAEPAEQKGDAAKVDETAQPAAPPAEQAKTTDTEPVKQDEPAADAPKVAAKQMAAEAPTRDPQQVAVKVTDAKFANNGKPLVVGQTIRFDANWSVPLDTEAGDYFTLTLPAEFAPTSTNQFPLVDNGSSSVLANCTWKGVTATCVFTERVEDIQSGNIWFTLTAKSETAENVNEVDFLFGSVTVPVELPGGIDPKPEPNPGNGGGTNPSPGTKAPANAYKSGYAQSDSGKFSWTIMIPAGGDTLSLVDTLNTGAGFEAHSYSGKPVLYYNEVNEEGYLTTWRTDTTFTAGSYSISEDGRTLTIKDHALNPKAAYRLNYNTEADGQLFTGDKVGNGVSLRGVDYTASATFKALAGGGGDPSQLGRFLIKKTVTGENAAAVPADTTFQVKAEWNGGGQDITLRNDGSAVQSKRVPAGTKITLSEVDLPAIDGVVWGTPVITGDGVTDNGDGTYSVTPQAGDLLSLVLTNTATKTPGAFSIEKLLTGEVADQVPAGTEFTVSYQIDGGDAVEATLTVGEPLVVDNVPAGSQVIITEIKLPEITDVVWGTPMFVIDGAAATETAAFTVGQDQTVQVKLTNTATPRPLVPGSFSIEKLLDGEALGKVPAGTEFTVSYQIGDAAAVEATLVVGQPLVIEGVPAGSQVSITEVKLPEVTDVVWGTPVFSVDGVVAGQSATFTVGEAQAVKVELTNTATDRPLLPGSFSIEKLLAGEGVQDVPAGTEFTVSYQINGGEAVEATLVVGQPLVVEGVPAGSQVSITEVKLPEVTDVVWGTPVFSVDGVVAGQSATFTVGEAQAVKVELTNTATPVPPVLGWEDEEPGEPTGSLPFTGNEGTAQILFTGLGLVILGAALVMARRRRAES
ncbi:MAG: DUF5979 domain-containing protein [Propionicimonas sp.]